MILEKKGNVSILSQEKGTVVDFLKKINTAYDKLKADNIIVNLFSLEKIETEQLAEFLQVSKQHKGANRSFVIVMKAISYDEIPETLMVVPTVQEAFDVIEMEEIERDLGL